jgi:methylenetetrahydrofolate--tRNA-(uracil-5-)-methyltransferase
LRGSEKLTKEVNIIGAGLAGSEAAYQLAKRGISVNLYEMKTKKKTDAQQSDFFAELVCSNSLRSNDLLNAAGLMKEELRKLDSLVIKAADLNKVPAGSALAVDRDLFSEYITKELKNNPLINIIEEEVTKIDFDKYTIIASGPLTSDALMQEIKDFLGEDTLYFFDAIAPIVEYDSINMDIAYFKSRYDKGDADYINCPMNKEQYDIWYNELINAKTGKKRLPNFNVWTYETSRFRKRRRTKTLCGCSTKTR